MNIDVRSQEEKMLLELNKFTQAHSSQFEYHMKHIQLAKEYAIVLSRRLGFKINERKLMYITYAHDILKEKGLNKKLPNPMWKGKYEIPQDLNAYVRKNLDILELFNLEDYFNTDINLHPLSAGIFLYKNFGIQDPEIIYPVMFHSCPIIEVYETLKPKVRQMVDIIMLADKLSSNYLRINMRKSEVRLDLDLAVFGQYGTELNYTLGLYLARLISMGKSKEKQSKIATEYYFNRLQNMNPLINKAITIKNIGGNKVWPERKSPVLKSQWKNSVQY